MYWFKLLLRPRCTYPTQTTYTRCTFIHSCVIYLYSFVSYALPFTMDCHTDANVCWTCFFFSQIYIRYIRHLFQLFTAVNQIVCVMCINEFWTIKKKKKKQKFYSINYSRSEMLSFFFSFVLLVCLAFAFTHCWLVQRIVKYFTFVSTIVRV